MKEVNSGSSKADGPILCCNIKAFHARNFDKYSSQCLVLTYRTVVSYQNDSFSSKVELPCLPPSSLELWRKERAKKQLSFWWKSLILIGHYGIFHQTMTSPIKSSYYRSKSLLHSRSGVEDEGRILDKGHGKCRTALEVYKSCLRD